MYAVHKFKLITKVVKVTLTEAKKSMRTLCGWED